MNNCPSLDVFIVCLNLCVSARARLRRQFWRFFSLDSSSVSDRLADLSSYGNDCDRGDGDTRCGQLEGNLLDSAGVLTVISQ